MALGVWASANAAVRVAVGLSSELPLDVLCNQHGASSTPENDVLNGGSGFNYVSQPSLPVPGCKPYGGNFCYLAWDSTSGHGALRLQFPTNHSCQSAKMRATSRLSKGFLGRSVDELKRFTSIGMGPAYPEMLQYSNTHFCQALNLEAVKGPAGPLQLHSFRTQESIQACKLMSDADIGGFSKAQLEWIPPRSSSDSLARGDNSNGHARFHGSISTQLPKDVPNVERSGYAAWRTLDRPRTLFGKSLWDIDPYAYLALRIKSDGRSYLVNVQTESIVPTDIHQHRLFSRRPGQWETVLIKWNDFVRTNHGYVVEPQTEMLRQKVRTIGIGLTDRIPGPFDLSIERIWATNDPNEAANSENGSPNKGGLKNKQGKNVTWVTD